MFTDNAKIYIQSGKGGDGHVSFRRELFVPAGGPDGGDGGRGGDIIFEVYDGLNTLTDFRHIRKYVAQNGEPGGKKRCHGADGKDLVIRVPEGTVIRDAESGKVIADKQQYLPCDCDYERQGRRRQHALCDRNHAGAELRKTGSGRQGTLCPLGTQGHRGCRSGRFPERRKIHLIESCQQRTPRDCQLSLYNPAPASRRC